MSSAGIRFHRGIHFCKELELETDLNPFEYAGVVHVTDLEMEPVVAYPTRMGETIIQQG